MKEQNRIIRYKELKEIVGNISRPTVDRWEKAGNFPKRIYVGKNIIGWSLEEINKWIEKKTISSNNTEILGFDIMNPGAKLILSRRNKLSNPFTARNIQQKEWTGLYDRETIGEALKCLVDYRHLDAIDSTPNIQGGRPTTYYYWRNIK